MKKRACADIFLHPEVQELIDAFARVFPAKITLFSARMEELRVALGNPGSRFCRIVREDLGLLRECGEMDRRMCGRSAESEGVTVYRCHAGLMEAILPVRIDGRVIAYFMLGQFRDSGLMEAGIAGAARKAGFPLPRLEEAYDAAPRFSAESIDDILRLFSMLVKFVAAQRYIAAQPEFLLDRVEAWIEGSIPLPFELERLARDLAKSPSVLSHTVKDKTGMSLRSLVALRKVEAFEDYMKSRPGAPIKEGSSMVGYPDPLHFSRVYRRVRGRSPRDFLSPKDG